MSQSPSKRSGRTSCTSESVTSPRKSRNVDTLLRETSQSPSKRPVRNLWADEPATSPRKSLNIDAKPRDESQSPSKRSARILREDESAASPRRSLNFDVKEHTPPKTRSTSENNFVPGTTESTPNTPSNTPSNILSNTPSNTRSRRKQTLTPRQCFDEEANLSVAQIEKDLNAPDSSKSRSSKMDVDNCSPSKTRPQAKNSSAQSPTKSSPRTPKSQSKTKGKPRSTPSKSDTKKTPSSSKRSATRASPDRFLPTTTPHSKTKRRVSITPLHEKVLRYSTSKDTRCSMKDIEEFLDEDVEENEESSAFQGKPSRTPRSDRSSRVRRRLDNSPEEDTLNSESKPSSAKVPRYSLNQIAETVNEKEPSVTPEKPSSSRKSRCQLDVTPPDKQAVSPVKEIYIPLSRIEESHSRSVSPQKPENSDVKSATKLDVETKTTKVDVASPEKASGSGRSLRRRRTPPRYTDDCITPNSAKRTPSRKEPVTPQSKKTPLRKTAPTTPRSDRRTPLRKSIFSTPQSAKFRVDPNTPRTPIDEVRANLHIAAVPKSLPCRQTEFETIYNFLARKIESQSGGVMYISGVPGTGKTATVHKVIGLLQEQAENKEIDSFSFVEVNALRVSEPRQAYVKIWKDLKGEVASVPVAQNSLEKRFSRPAKEATIILVDELDYLCNRKQDVIYNILDWTTKRDSQLIVLTIANTMDLPERTLKGRVTSRMGLTRLIFQPYTHTQLQQIVMDRLDKYNVFHPDAVQLVSRKVAAVSGDARRALDICRKATEFADKDKMVVTIQDVQKVLNNIFAGPRIQTIQNCSEIEKLILRSLRDESHRTGVEDTYLKKMYRTLTALCSIEALHVPDIGCTSQLCTKLCNMGLIIAENTSNAYLYRKLILNVSVDDLHFALGNLNSS